MRETFLSLIYLDTYSSTQPVNCHYM